MPRPVPTTLSLGRPASRAELAKRVMRYAAGSVVATVCSEVTFLVLYGLLDSSPAVASVLGWLAGALPNYWLNRTWTWRRRGRPDLRTEVLPYAAIVAVTLLLATAATSLVHDELSGGQVSDGVRLVLVGGTFLSVYGAVFVARFFLLDRLFRQPSETPPLDAVGGPKPDEAVAKEAV